jgi:hypothetical protein
LVEEQRIVRRTTVSPQYPVEQDILTIERTRRSDGADFVRRVVVFVFGVIQVLLLLRIVGLLIDANRNNAIVQLIYDTTAILVAPFEGIIRTDTVNAGASVLDVTAIVALIGWTILEALILAAIGILRREPA